MVNPKLLNIDVVYANTMSCQVLSLQVQSGSTVEDVIHQSNIKESFPEIDLALNKIGVFGKIIAKSAFVKEGDRVEIYRPLKIDPKQARKLRAKKQQTV